MRNMKIAASQSGSKSAADGESNDVDKYFVNQVKKRQEKVDRLKGELGALNAHLAKLFESFSVPTYPQGTCPSCNSRLSRATFLFLPRFQSCAFIDL